jgi:hypothetical protein
MPASRSDIQCRSEWNVSLQWYLHLYQAFVLCINTEWGQARKMLHKLDARLQNWNFQDVSTLQRWTTYLHGVVEQGTGNGESASQIFRSPILMNTPKSGQSKNKRLAMVHDDVSILSRINLLFILRSPDRPPTAEAQQILSELETMVPQNHHNPVLRTSVALISAVLNPREAITKTKGALRTALQASRASNNAQLLSISMTAMVSIFFMDITTGDQARQARNVALELAQRAGDPLWIAVANGMALQGELDPEKIEERHKDLDKVIGGMDENARKQFLNSQDDAMEED